VLPANLLTDHGIQIGSALDTLLLSMGLAARINELRSEKARAQREAFESQGTLVEALRKAERELEGRVAQRTSELEDMSRQMHYQAQHDALTGLPNRYLLRDRLEQASARAKRDRGAFAVLMIDLDNFKTINDTLGHDVGDLLLVEVSRRLAICMRERDTIARLGGDEFVAVLEELVAAEDSAIVAGKIVEALAAPVSIGGELLRTSPSIGISLYPEDAQDPDFLMKFADIAMYRAKAAGRNCHRFYRDPPPLHAYDAVRTDTPQS
jgi:diguanylate cyclase (GGDEF)-like protein